MNAFVIEHDADCAPQRLVVVHSRFGGHSFSLDEASALITAVGEALVRALDPTPLPEALPRRPFTPAASPRRGSTALEDLA